MQQRFCRMLVFAGISNYERWRANLLAAEGYVGTCSCLWRMTCLSSPQQWQDVLLAVKALRKQSMKDTLAQLCCLLLLRFTVQPLLSAAYAAAAFVADIYGTAIKQGPSLPVANRSALMTDFRSNSTRFRNRILTTLTQVTLYRRLHICTFLRH